MNRETWLLQAVDALRPAFSAAGVEIPEAVKVSCGFPSSGGLGTKRRVLGECWEADCATDHLHQIYINPTLADGVRALGVLTHELIHAALPAKTKHGPLFKRTAVKLGLTGPATATQPGEALQKDLERLIERLGPYPQAELRPKDKEKKQSTRMLKLFCPANDYHTDTYVLRGSRKIIDIGLPVCPCGKTLEEAAPEDEDE